MSAPPYISSIPIAVLIDHAARALHRAHQLGRPVLFSASATTDSLDALAFYAWSARRGTAATYVERPGDGFLLVGAGCAAALPVSDDTETTWLRMYSEAERVNAEPLLIGGAAFDQTDSPGEEWASFPRSMLILPAQMLSRSGEQWQIIGNLLVEPGTTPEHAAAEMLALLGTAPFPEKRCEDPDLILTDTEAPWWHAAVEEVKQSIAAGRVTKVVLSRTASLRASSPLCPARALARLRASYPSCTIFALTLGESTFLGATPERLVSLHGQHVSASSLAGSRPRGRSPEEDRHIQAELLSSAKDLHEHAVVVEALLASLRPYCTDIYSPARPALLGLDNVQHLHTPISGVTRPGTTILDLARAVHPTPAVCGWPREEARDMIRRLEPHRRGWYTGPVGWIDGHGDGELFVALRSGVVRGSEAVLYAGCGIVEGSDADKELRESETKLTPMLQALGATRR